MKINFLFDHRPTFLSLYIHLIEQFDEICMKIFMLYRRLIDRRSYQFLSFLERSTKVLNFYALQ